VRAKRKATREHRRGDMSMNHASRGDADQKGKGEKRGTTERGPRIGPTKDTFLLNVAARSEELSSGAGR